MKYESSYKLNENDSKIFKDITNNSVKCKCGHSVLMAKQNKTICTHCGRWVFKNDAEEFKYRLMEKMKKRYE